MLQLQWEFKEISSCVFISRMLVIEPYSCTLYWAHLFLEIAMGMFALLIELMGFAPNPNILKCSPSKVLNCPLQLHRSSMEYACACVFQREREGGLPFGLFVGLFIAVKACRLCCLFWKSRRHSSGAPSPWRTGQVGNDWWLLGLPLINLLEPSFSSLAGRFLLLTTRCRKYHEKKNRLASERETSPSKTRLIVTVQLSSMNVRRHFPGAS